MCLIISFSFNWNENVELHTKVNTGKIDNNTTFIPRYCVYYFKNAVIIILQLNMTFILIKYHN